MDAITAEKVRRLRLLLERSTAWHPSPPAASGVIRKSPPLRQRVEDCINGCCVRHELGEFFLARQALPFGRPYGKLRIADISTSDLSPLSLFLNGAAIPALSRLVYLDTETTGLADDAGACAFLIGIGFIEGTQFIVQQFFLRDFAEERAALAALSEALAQRDGLITYNGKAFDVPLLERRYSACRLPSPLGRLLHLDVLHPARQIWKLRLKECHLTNLERHVLGVARDGDVPGSDIPGLYFDYLRTGDARGLQPVFFHNALDIVSLAALGAEMAGLLIRCEEPVSRANAEMALDLFSLSRIFARAGNSLRSLDLCRRALSAGLAPEFEPSALWHLAREHKRRREFEDAAAIWQRLAHQDHAFAAASCRELAIHFERRKRDLASALRFTETALRLFESGPGGAQLAARADDLARRRERLLRRAAQPLKGAAARQE